ncbi:hypothetical protein VitviT2T_013713 [Vitis vinifera]|uniref:Integrase catalytic domain-containing protein n=1 Tax=Vitis vinifera TaxID=29760 RepID=A0ABY9CLS1_VITVI|nr:hypothetical protein VitviT2T_013713 [Vitis vinifera]
MENHRFGDGDSVSLLVALLVMVSRHKLGCFPAMLLQHHSGSDTVVWRWEITVPVMVAAFHYRCRSRTALAPLMMPLQGMNFKAKVENQLSKKIKVVRSDRGGEYYGRYDGSSEQRPGLFAKYLMECGIVPQYTMLGTPIQNGVADRRNRTLKDMIVQSITEIQNTLEIPPAQVMEPVQVYEEVTQQPQEPQIQVPLRRSTREMRSTISDDYVVHLQEQEFDMGLEDDPISVSQVKQSSDSEKWIEAIKDEMKSMKDNGVWDLVKLPESVKSIGCKWIFKTKWDSKGNIVRYKARLVAKGFTQKEDIDYKEIFSSVLSNDSFRIIMALVAHYDLELHQMDVKTAFLNGNIDETIFMMQPENFESNDLKQLVCRLKRSIYGLKQAS